ncbi:MAG: GMC family oxidoreductase [Maricaulaceae bacterium]
MALRTSLLNSDLPSQLDVDICIIGGGVAGQTLAQQLSRYNLKTLILESGERDFRKDIQTLAQGENIGEDYYPLESSRLRLFGGTAAIWGGRCAELDPIDFEKRDYLPHSGWPFPKSELDPYYDAAFASLGLKRPGEGRLWPVVDREAPEFDPKKLDTDLWVFDENGERFTNLSRDGLDVADILLGATVTDIDVSEQGEVTGLTAKALNDKTVRVVARCFVVAAGAIESARILMAAVPSRPNGIGNDNDILGRFFMEHPHARGGEIIPNDLAHALTVLPRALRVEGKRYAAYMRPAPDLQRKEGILNTSISFAARRRAGESMEMHNRLTHGLKHSLPSSKFWRTLYKRAKGLAIKGLEKTDPKSTMLAMKLQGEKLGVFAVVRAEQAPNPDSRIVLGEATDAFGVRRAQLDWQLLDIDRHSVRVLMETLADEYKRLGWGEVIPSKWLSDENVTWRTDKLISAHPIGGYHHMGGVRMGDSDQTGVVDANCKLFESPNLYVASSGVFPTGGWANPTVTIMALALRLGDHLGQKLSA